MNATAPVMTTTDTTIFHAAPRLTGGGGAGTWTSATSLMRVILACAGPDSNAARPSAHIAALLTRGGARRRLHPGDLVEVAAEHLHAARGLTPVVVLVDGVVPVLGQRQAHEGHGGLQQAAHREHGADRAALAREGGLAPERLAHGLGRRGVVRAAERREVRLERAFPLDDGVRELLLDEALDEREDLVGPLRGHEARRELGLGP